MQEFTADPQFLRTALVITLVTLPLKGWALWRSAQSQQRGWYIAMLILNTFGILELTYLFYFSKSQPKEQK